ncbi:MAG: NAD(P)H-dependent oxidoreductase, partial [Acidimicrobiales bacterium]
PMVMLFRLYSGEEPSSEELARAKRLVLVYPTWWGGMPGRLLEWFQFCFARWIDGDAALEDSPLREVRRLTAVTTHGATSIVNRMQGEPGRQLLQRTGTRLCAQDVEFEWIPLYGSDKSDDETRQKFLTKVTSLMSSSEDQS